MHFSADTPLGYALLILLGAVASGINAVAGGGTLISFPVLTIPFGIPSRMANATNSTGLWPGSLSGAFGFINLFKQTERQLKLLLVPTLLGSIVGALLLVSTRQKIFDAIIPVLILLATGILAFQPYIKKWAANQPKKLPMWVGILLQFLVAIYGGYFGAGMGIMMLATISLTVEGNVHELNSLKNWLAVVINIACTALFFFQRLILLLPASALVVGGLIGGYVGARTSQRFDPNKLRWAIVAYGVVMTGVFIHQAMTKAH